MAQGVPHGATGPRQPAATLAPLRPLRRLDPPPNTHPSFFPLTPGAPQSPVGPRRGAAQVDGEPEPLVAGRPPPGGAAGVVLAARRLGLQGVVEGAEHSRRQPPVQLLQQLLGPLAAGPGPRRPLGRLDGLRAQREKRRAQQRRAQQRRPHLQRRRRQRGWDRARPPPLQLPSPHTHTRRAPEPPGRGAPPLPGPQPLTLSRCMAVGLLEEGEESGGLAEPRRATGSLGGGAVGKVPRSSLHLPWPRMPGTF